MQEYADPVIDWLDAGQGILRRRFFREVCATSRSLIILRERASSPRTAVLYSATKWVVHQEYRAG